MAFASMRIFQDAESIQIIGAAAILQCYNADFVCKFDLIRGQWVALPHQRPRVYFLDYCLRSFVYSHSRLLVGSQVFSHLPRTCW